uniref:ATP synthase F0 subunit b n=1 Tax=Cryptomonas gyropyrenoidosa TaxID=233257 RepID=UPI00279D4E2E|nr:ATP synthase F0 subunit b [Cryptomonas gyropyrenoidosa]WFQ82678.1 ATP synthase F0 subunit b [Cryptomonas gyropyrenoidosa]
MDLKKYLLPILIILTLVSKEILIFNEELLVLFSSFVFLFLSYNFFSNSISLELDKRSSKIQEEFQYYKGIHETLLNKLLSYHKKQKYLFEEIKGVIAITQNNISLIRLNYQQIFNKCLINSISDKLKKIDLYQSKSNLILQDKISYELYKFLISNYSLKNDKKEYLHFLANCLQNLSKIK